MKPGGCALILLLESFRCNIRQWGKDLLSALSLSTRETLFSDIPSAFISTHTGYTAPSFWEKRTKTPKKPHQNNKWQGTNRIRGKFASVRFGSQFSTLHLPGFFVMTHQAASFKFLKGIQYLQIKMSLRTRCHKNILLKCTSTW